MEEVILEFDDQDNPIISVKGVKGNVCQTWTADLEKKLGKVTSKEKTREYYEQEESHERGIRRRN